MLLSACREGASGPKEDALWACPLFYLIAAEVVLGPRSGRRPRAVGLDLEQVAAHADAEVAHLAPVLAPAVAHAAESRETIESAIQRAS